MDVRYLFPVSFPNPFICPDTTTLAESATNVVQENRFQLHSVPGPVNTTRQSIQMLDGGECLARSLSLLLHGR